MLTHLFKATKMQFTEFPSLKTIFSKKIKNLLNFSFSCFLAILMLSFLLLYSPKAYGAKEPMKYGKVEKSELEMTVYPADTSASAVILCQYGYYNSSQNQFVHQIRIKILKEEGKSQGNFYVPAAEKTNVKGQTVNVENGKEVVTKLGKDGIFIEKVMRDVYRARVAMPNVKVGSVLDVEFYFNGIPSYWTFQSTIPMKWSELIIEDNQYLTFRKNYVGFVTLESSENNRWVAKDVPAFVSEPFVNNSKNYMARFDFEIQSIHIPGYYYKDYATTWKAVAETFNNDDDFGKKIDGFNLFLNSVEKTINQTANGPYAKMQKAFETIKAFKWNDVSSAWISSNGLESAYNKKVGNACEINLSLLILLRKLGFEAYPVVLSTRDNGTLPKFSVSLSRFNYVVVQVKIGEKNYLLDATEKYLPINMLPERALNESGLVILKDDFVWADLLPQKKNKWVNVAQLKLTEDGTLNGEYNFTKFEYSALNHRINYKSFNSQEEYLDNLEKKYPGLSIEKYSCIDFDSIENPLTETMEVIFKNQTTKLNDQIFINPITFDRLKENPFKIEERLYPVDFTHPVDRKDVIMIEIPEGYTVEQLPKNIKMQTPDNTASFQMQSTVQNNKIQILFKLNINKPIFYTGEYRDLKNFYDELVKKQSEMIALKKI